VAETDEQLDKAAKMVEEILFNPEKAHEIKQQQLRQYVAFWGVTHAHLLPLTHLHLQGCRE
jgi:hypothetical protein